MVFKELEIKDWEYPDSGDCIEGVLISKKFNVGPNKVALYLVETQSGFMNVWGATILDARMVPIKEGDKIRITYKGLGEAKEDQNAPKIFKLEVDID